MISLGHGIIEVDLRENMRGCEPERFSGPTQKNGKEIENLVLAGKLELGKNIEYDECMGWAEKYRKMADGEEVLSQKAFYRRVEAGLYLVVNDIEKALCAYNDVKYTYILESQQVVGKEGIQEKVLAERLGTFIGDYSALTSDLEEALREQ